MAGIYIHIPFCKQKCSYCNFHFSTRLEGKSDIQRALLREIEMRGEELSGQSIETIYLGGGTPSLWPAKDIVALYSAIRSVSPDTSPVEFTIECNPDDLTLEYLQDLKKHTPVNRISLGIQSFHDADLKWMNRSHDARQAHFALESIFSTGFREVSADLIFGLPDSDMEKWKRNLNMLTQYPVHHISCYNLTIEERTAFHYQLEQGRITLPDEEMVIAQYNLAGDLLGEKGFLHYEISNYARPGHLAVHNTNYWKNVPYVGFGPSAHSYDGHRRRWNIADNRKYVKAIESGTEFWESEELSTQDRINEYIMTGLRTIWGVDESKIALFGADFLEDFQQNAQRYIHIGQIALHNGNYVLTQQGQAIADRIISDFFQVNDDMG